MDDANFLVPLEDVELLLDTFTKIATPLGAVMNTEKTRILTSISNQSTLERLKAQSSPTFASRNRAISRYSRKQLHDGTFIPLEVITGLRVLGVPIGSKQFCHQFHEDRKSLTFFPLMSYMLTTTSLPGHLIGIDGIAQ